MKSLIFSLFFLAPFMAVQVAQAGVPNFSPIVKNADGMIRQMEREEAEKYCSSIGGTLPTARDYASLAISMGAQGTRETNYPNKHHTSNEVDQEAQKMLAAGYSPVVTENGAVDYPYPGEQNSVAFYYNKSGYVRPSGNWDRNWIFWTKTLVRSSLCQGSESTPCVANIFDSWDGSIDYSGKYFYTSLASVRCVLQ